MKKVLSWLLCCMLLLTPACVLAEDGIFEGTGAGHGGDLTVTMEVKDGKITSVTVKESHQETPGISDAAIETLPASIVEHQSLAVDTVAGATITSKGILEAATAAAAAAGLDMDALTKPLEKAPAEGKEIDMTADVIIVGGGGAGLAAAVAATDNGSSVIVLEKMGALGGNTIVCGGIYNCPDPELQEPAGIEDSVELFIKQTWEGGDKVANIDLVTTMCENSYDGLKWLESMGMEFRDYVNQGPGSLYPRTHEAVEVMGTGFINTYVRNLKEKGDLCQILLNTTGDALIVQDNKVVGVTAHDTQGNTYTLHSNQGVILATGGFAGNVELRQRFCEGDKWKDLGEGVLTTNTPGVTGDGIFMAEAVGANLVDMEQIQLLHLGNPKNGTTDGMTHRCLSVDYVIYVNKEGKRFVREDGRRDEICNAILSQPDGIMYILESSDDNETPIEEARTHEGGKLTDAIARGDVIMADTLEEMAQKLGCDPAVLQATVDEYNAMVDAGKDELTGRVLLKNKLLTGPYFATPRVPSAHHTMGGVQIDTQCRVLRPDGSIIEGLLAAGEVTGGIHGGNRLGGNAVVDTVVFGRIAGQTASQLAK